MVAKGSKERVKTLLKDTITLLCKNGLEFKDNFTVEALIGVTLDNSEVLLISMNEIVKSENASCSFNEKTRDKSQAPDTTSEKSRSESAKSRKRPRSVSPIDFDEPAIKLEPQSPSHSDDNQDSYNPKSEDLWGGGDPPSLSPSTLDDTAGPSASHALTPGRLSQTPQQTDESNESQSHWNPAGIKAEHSQAEEEEEEDEEDIVFVKEEGSEHSRSSCSQQSSSQRYQQQSNQSFSQSSDMTLLPVNSQDGSMLWSQASHSGTGTGGTPVRRNYAPRMPRTPTDGSNPNFPGSDQHDQSMQSQQRPQQGIKAGASVSAVGRHGPEKTSPVGDPSVYRYQCPYCQKRFRATSMLRGHISWHTGIKEFKCALCNVEFRYKNHQKEHYITKHGVRLNQMRVTAGGWTLN